MGPCGGVMNVIWKGLEELLITHNCRDMKGKAQTNQGDINGMWRGFERLLSKINIM